MSSGMNQESPYFLSIIIPAFNEEARLPESLPKVIEFVGNENYPIEVIIVDDGSTDHTAAVVREFQKQASFISLLQVEHGGKGHAVKAGMLQAKGLYLFLCDCDLSMPIQEINKFLPPNVGGYDIAIASREAKGARRYNEPSHRHFMGRVFNLLVRSLAIHGIQDTQAGFKCFRREIGQLLFSQQTIKGWGFDVEILFIAQKHRLNIIEVPINWYYQEASKVKPVRDTYNMVREILKIRLNAWQGLYSFNGLQLSGQLIVDYYMTGQNCEKF